MPYEHWRIPLRANRARPDGVLISGMVKDASMKVGISDENCFIDDQQIPPSAKDGDRMEPREVPGADNTALDVLIMYEDLPTGLRAKQALDHLSGELGVSPGFNVKPWTFQMLLDSVWRERVLQEASHAQILFLSLHGSRELPVAVRELIQHCLANRNEHPIALVISLDEEFQGSVFTNGVLHDLQARADAEGVDWFPHFGPTPSPQRNCVSQEVPFRDDASQTDLGLPSCTRRFREGDSRNSRLSAYSRNQSRHCAALQE